MEDHRIIRRQMKWNIAKKPSLSVTLIMLINSFRSRKKT